MNFCYSFSTHFFFPSHIKRIIFCFVYSVDHQPSFIYPSLEEEAILSACVVDTDPQPPDPISSHPTVTVEPCHQCVKPHIQPTSFQTRIKDMLFEPLKLPYHLHPYPPDFFKYIPHFSGEDHVTTERHVEAFENFVGQFEIAHDDVAMRFFSNSLFGDVAVWFKCLGADSISSWIELCNAFLKWWGENKSLD
jgi:hypothetical protein